MKKPDEFDTILDECLESILSGESVEACLERYPDHAEELRPLLETAFEARDAADIAPRPEFRQEASRQFQQALHDLPVRRPVGTFSLRHWWVSAVLVLAIIVLSGGGTVFAANTAQPDNFFYPVKLATESVRISLARSDQSKARLYAEFTQQRVNEIVAMAAKGDAEAVAKATDHLDSQLVAMAGVVGSESAENAAASKFDQGTLRAPVATTTTTATATTTTAMPMAVPTPTPTAAPTPTPAPTTTTITPSRAVPAATTPATTSPTAPSPTALFSQAVPSASGTAGFGSGEAGSFGADVADQASEAVQKLQAALASAPESARPGLEHALEVVTSGYNQVLHGLNK